jgi:hypothetical protein
MATVGGVSEIKGNQNSLEIDGLARYAVDEHNKKEVFLIFYFFFYVLTFVMVFHIIIF